MHASNDHYRPQAAVLSGLLMVSLTVAMSGVAHAQSESAVEAAASCRDAAELGEAGDIDAAVEEARWCLEVFETIRRDAAFAVFPESLDGWSGGELQNQSAMGMTILSRTYTKASRSIDISVTTGVAGSGLAALAQLGASLGAGQGDKFRVQRRTVTDMSDTSGESVNYLVELRSGGVMNVESATASASEVREFLEVLPITEIDEALDR